MIVITFQEKKTDLWKDDLHKTDLMAWAEKAYDEDYYQRLCYTNFNYETHGLHHECYRDLVLRKFPISEIKTVGVLGCGIGFSVRAWKKMGCIVKGCDISKWCVENKLEPEIIRADIKNTPYENEEFDLVINSSVLEHIFSDHFSAVVEEINRVCKKFVVSITVWDSDRYDATDYTHCSHIEGYQRSKEWYKQKFEKYFDVEFVEWHPSTLPGETWNVIILTKKSL